jgi:hypothetical protein
MLWRGLLINHQKTKEIIKKMGTENVGSILVINAEGEKAIEMFLSPIFTGKALSDKYNVMTNVTAEEKKIYTLTHPEEIVQDGAIGWNAVGSVGIRSRNIRASKLKVNFPILADQFDSTVLAFLQGSGNSTYDPTSRPSGKQVMAAIQLMVQQAITKDVRRLADFANYTATPPAFYTKSFDGILTLIERGVGQGDVTQVSAGSGAALAAGDSIDIFDALIAAQPRVLRGTALSMKEIRVTSTILDKYYTYLLAQGVQGAYVDAQTGITTFKYKGYDVIEEPDWDDVLSSKFSLSNQHRAVLTVKKNFTIGTDLLNQDFESNPEFMLWYAPKEEEWYLKTRFRMGVNYAQDDLLVYAK